jgi:hypothetical protein
MVTYKSCPEANVRWLSAKHLHSESSNYTIKSFLHANEFRSFIKFDLNFGKLLMNVYRMFV